MAEIIDISPTTSNTDLDSSDFRTTGRMISIAASDDGKVVLAGSLSSNVWMSEDGGDSWDQIAWPQPPEGQFGVPGAMGGFCVPAVAVAPEAGRWLVERDPRFVADLTGNGAADIVGFGATGVWTALGNGDGTFQPARVVVADFGFETGGWRVDRHPRVLADLTGTGSADIVGFGDRRRVDRPEQWRRHLPAAALRAGRVRLRGRRLARREAPALSRRSERHRRRRHRRLRR